MSDFVTEPSTQQAEAGIGYFGNNPVFGARDNLTASTTHSIAGGTAIDRNTARFTTVANANDAATLPQGFPGLLITVINSGANNLQVYGANSGDTLNGVAGSTGLSLMPGSVTNFYCTSISKGNGIWYVQDIGVGNSGNYPTLAYQASLTAGTTQSAAGGTSITSSIAEFTTVASSGNAATLPPAQPGMQIAVVNNDSSSHNLTVYAATAALGGVAGGDTVNGSTSLAVGNAPVVTIFFCTKQGVWLSK